MAFFDFDLSTFQDNNTISKSILNNSLNFTPTGKSIAIKTSASHEEAKVSLTTWNVSDILQNNVSIKPEGLIYTQFNEQISNTSKLAYSIKVNGNKVNFPGKTYLTAFDVGGASKNVLDFNISTGGTLASANTYSGTPAPPSSGFVLTGNYRFPTFKTHYQDPGSGTTAIDIGHNAGAPVFSPWDGKVEYIGYPEGGTVKGGSTKDINGGYSIVIVGDNGWSIYMCHFQGPPIVDIGSRVTKGQNVAFVGETGRAYGPHVHVSVAHSTNYADTFNNPIQNIWDFMKSLEIQSQNGSSNGSIYDQIQSGGMGFNLGNG